MTRETKIGLLVGLAFIIVIGILLSDHLTSSTEPPPASLATAGNSVRNTVTTPGGTQSQPQPIVTPPQVQPQQQVATQRELTPAVPPTAIVQVAGPPAQTQAQTQPPSRPPITVVSNDMATTPPQPAPVPEQPATIASNDPLVRIAQQQNEPLVTVTPTGQTQPLQSSPPGAGPQLASYKEYTAQPGDSVSRIAMSQLGSNTKANRDAILRANPSLQANPNMVIVGKSYRIPSSADAMAVTVAPAPQPTQTVVTTSTAEYWYTVKEGDSLWRIASEQLGKGGSGVAAIKELNKDVLNGGETVHPNMRLRLPAKPLVQAN